MSLTTKQLMQQNLEKQKQLNEANKKFYEDLLVYIRMVLFKDERATEEVLYEMLDHLILAQNEGKTAQQVFGKEPKELADEIIETLPKEQPKKIWSFGLELMAMLFGIYITITGIPVLISQEQKVYHFGNVLLFIAFIILLFVLLIYLTMKMTRKQAFQEVQKPKWPYIVGGLYGVVMMGGLIGLRFIGPIGMELVFSSNTLFGFGCFLLLASYLLKKMRLAK